MIRRLLCACMGAAVVGALTGPVYVIAKPPDLPEDGTFTATPTMAPLAPFSRLGKLLHFPNEHPQTVINDDVLKDAPYDPDEETRISSWGRYGGRSPYICDQEWWKWLIAHWTVRQQPPPPEQNDGYLRPISTSIDFAFPVDSDPPDSRDEKKLPTVEVLPIPQEVPDATCPYLRQKMMDRQTCQLADPDLGRDVLDNLKRLKRADKLLDQAKKLARAGLFTEAMDCCSRATKLCPGSPCAKRASDAMIDLALGFVVPSSASEEDSEPQPNAVITPEKKSSAIDYEFEVGANTDGGLHMCADCSVGGNVYHLRYKHGCISIWRTSDGGKMKP